MEEIKEEEKEVNTGLTSMTIALAKFMTAEELAKEFIYIYFGDKALTLMQLNYILGDDLEKKVRVLDYMSLFVATIKQKKPSTEAELYEQSGKYKKEMRNILKNIKYNN